MREARTPGGSIHLSHGMGGSGGGGSKSRERLQQGPPNHGA